MTARSRLLTLAALLLIAASLALLLASRWPSQVQTERYTVTPLALKP